MTLPVSVIIPSLSSRREFLSSKCIPAVLANDPAELFVLVSNGGGDGNSKRNTGAYAATQDYLMFVDDDCILRPGCIARMLEEISRCKGSVDFVYSDYRMFSEGSGFPKGELKQPGHFSVDSLHKANYINTMSLIRRGSFPGFDPEIKRLQDWDLWLTMTSRGSKGAYIQECLFDSWHIDKSVSMTIPFDEARAAIVKKHGLK